MPSADPVIRKEWERDCKKLRGTILRGFDWHWCADWDSLPVAALIPEYDCCVCYKKTWAGRVQNWFFMRYFYAMETRVRKG